MRLKTLALALGAAAAAACGRADKQAAKASPSGPDLLADVPVLPHSVVYDLTNTADAWHRGMRIDWPMDSVAAFYRRVLPAEGWRVVSDLGDTAAVNLYLEKVDRSLWVQLRRTGPGSSAYAFTAAGRGAGGPPP